MKSSRALAAAILIASTSLAGCGADVELPASSAATSGGHDAGASPSGACPGAKHEMFATTGLSRWAGVTPGPGTDFLAIGYASEAIELGSLQTSGETTFFARLDRAGHPISVQPVEARGPVTGDGKGNLVMFNTGFGAEDFGTGPVGTPGVPNLFILTRNAAGEVVAALGIPFFPHMGELSYAAFDGAGNLLIGGTFVGDLQIGSTLMDPAIDGKRGFVAKIDPAGEVLWARQVGELTDQGSLVELRGLAVGPAGEVLVAGYLGGSIDLAGTPLVTGDDGAGFVLKLDSAGDPVWSHVTSELEQQPPGGGLEPLGIAVTTDGDAVLSGCHGTDGFCPLKPGVSDALVVVKLAANGDLVWRKSYEGAASGTPAVDGSGDVLVLGQLAGTVDFGGGSLSATGAGRTFAVRLDPQGELRCGALGIELYGDLDSPKVAVTGFALGPAGDALVLEEATTHPGFGPNELGVLAVPR